LQQAAAGDYPVGEIVRRGLRRQAVQEPPRLAERLELGRHLGIIGQGALQVERLLGRQFAVR